ARSSPRLRARGVERFMKHYFLIAKEVGDLTRILCAVLEEQHKRKPRLSFSAITFRKRNIDGFDINSGRLAVTTPDEFTREPVKLLKLFHAAHVHGMDIHPNTLHLVTRNLSLLTGLREHPEANRLFLEILTSAKNPINILRMMNESGVLGRFLPDFGRVVAQMQYDMYHVYTTDEHTLRAIGVVHEMETDSFEEMSLSCHLIHQVQSRRALYVAVLLHDIAKGRGADHSSLGADVALKLGPRLGLTAEETDTVSWLVGSHLLMARVAFKRDIDDPKTVEDFVKAVQSPERLRLLVILTCADVRAVGPTSFNGWKATLLRDLFQRAEEAMSGVLAVPARDHRVAVAKDQLRAALTGWSTSALENYLGRGYPAYWPSFDTATHVRHAHMIADAEANQRDSTVELRQDPARHGTEITVYTGDHPGVFAQIAGAFALAGESIADAKIITMVNGMALDTFWIQGPSGSDEDIAKKLRKIETTIIKVLEGKLWPRRELKNTRSSGLSNRTQVFKVPPRVIIDNTASKTHTVIEVNGRDRPGFLFDVTSALTGCSLQISSAQVATFGERVVDVFYVKDVFGMRVEHEAKLRQIRDELFKAISDPATITPLNDAPLNETVIPAPTLETVATPPVIVNEAKV
ncbi:MAG: [protein-PII] uridylyltransferase, partial [Alphaproteobacteria bacterium]|nr:[protein-PII] uridylyltransferase [Alphaproteobacteria bacterium]